MTTIELKFPANRFHGTPWGRHVNEGAVDWPPSSYRLARALYDTWKRKHAEAPEADVEALLKLLGEEPPRYAIPAATATHTRSYLSSNTFDPTEKSLIFDGFVAMEPNAALYMTWPRVDLTMAQSELLDRLLGSMNYLGRSESWVAARVHGGVAEAEHLCEPAETSTASGELTPVACLTPPGDYQEKGRWLDAIAYSTAEFQKDRRSAPPAMRVVQYVRPDGAVGPCAPRACRTRPGPQAVVFELKATVLPLITECIRVAEAVRRRLMGCHRSVTGDPQLVSRLFSGKDASGSPLKGHEQAFILPLGNERGRIERVLVYTKAANGFAPDEVEAILRVEQLHGVCAERPVRVIAANRGGCEDQKIRPAARMVASTTPFLAPRHWRPGRGDFGQFLAAEVRRECENHGLPAPLRIEAMPHSGGIFEWVEFRRNRKDDAPKPGYGFRLEFPKPVATPFSLGYGCHFGLGQFGKAE